MLIRREKTKTVLGVILGNRDVRSKFFSIHNHTFQFYKKSLILRLNSLFNSSIFRL